MPSFENALRTSDSPILSGTKFPKLSITSVRVFFCGVGAGNTIHEYFRSEYWTTLEMAGMIQGIAGEVLLGRSLRNFNNIRQCSHYRKRSPDDIHVSMRIGYSARVEERNL